MDHGGDLTEAIARFGEGEPAWLDLSTGINPRPWEVPASLRQAGWERLPAAADLGRLIAAARRAYGIPQGAGVVAGPGTQALIQWLPRLARVGEVAILGPTYGEHASAWAAGGHLVREVGSPDELGAACHAVVVNPNNPDGRLVGPSSLRGLADLCAARGGWCVVDEAFVDVTPRASVARLAESLPVIVLRSFGKFYGLAGLRLGFAVAPVALADRLRGALGPWALSGPAIAVGTAALADSGWAEATRTRLARDARALDDVLAGAGLEPAGGTDLFRLVRHPRAGVVHDRLVADHIWVRRFGWGPDLLRFGLPPDGVALERLRRSLALATA